MSKGPSLKKLNPRSAVSICGSCNVAISKHLKHNFIAKKLQLPLSDERSLLHSNFVHQYSLDMSSIVHQ
jgi:hypothetical protein